MSEIIGLIGRGVAAPTISLDGLEHMDPDARHAARQVIERFVRAMAKTGAPEEHPFRGATALDLQPADLERLAGELSQAIGAIDALRDGAASCAAQVRQPTPDTLAEVAGLVTLLASLGGAPENAAGQIVQSMLERADDPRLIDALAAGRSWAEARQGADSAFAAPAWNANVGSARSGLVAGRDSFLKRIFGPYRKASADLAGLLTGPLPKKPRERLALIDQLLGGSGASPHPCRG